MQRSQVGSLLQPHGGRGPLRAPSGRFDRGAFGAGFRLVTEVEVRRGWAYIYIVSVHSGLSRADASPAFG